MCSASTICFPNVAARFGDMYGVIPISLSVFVFLSYSSVNVCVSCIYRFYENDCVLISPFLPSHRRLSSAGIPCPEPITVTQNVLIMTFIGEGGWPSPRLRDANLVCYILLSIHDWIIRD